MFLSLIAPHFTDTAFGHAVLVKCVHGIPPGFPGIQGGQKDFLLAVHLTGRIQLIRRNAEAHIVAKAPSAFSQVRRQVMGSSMMLFPVSTLEGFPPFPRPNTRSPEMLTGLLYGVSPQVTRMYRRVSCTDILRSCVP